MFKGSDNSEIFAIPEVISKIPEKARGKSSLFEKEWRISAETDEITEKITTKPQTLIIEATDFSTLFEKTFEKEILFTKISLFLAVFELFSLHL